MGPRSFDDLDIRDTSYGCRIELGGNNEIQLTGVSAHQLTADDLFIS